MAKRKSQTKVEQLACKEPDISLRSSLSADWKVNTKFALVRWIKAKRFQMNANVAFASARCVDENCFYRHWHKWPVKSATLLCMIHTCSVSSSSSVCIS